MEVNYHTDSPCLIDYTVILTMDAGSSHDNINEVMMR